jgi:hypothetical protein
MSVHRIAVMDAQRMSRAKTSILTMMTRQDRYRISDTWHAAAERWQDRETVDEVNHFGRHTVIPGDMLIIEQIDGKPIMHAQVDSIRMAQTDTLTSADFTALGYTSREEFAVEWQDMFGGKVWLYQIARVDSRSDLPETVRL